MKTQRRHELQTNTLADHLGQYLLQIEPYTKQILLGIVAVLAIVAAWMYFSAQRQAQSAVGWNDFFGAFAEHNSDGLEEVAKLHHDSNAALWASLTAADIKLAQGAGRLYSDRKEAVKSLEAAEKLYLDVEKRADSQKLLLRRAQFGLGQTYESLSDVKKARQYYEIVGKEAPDSALGKAAKKRFDALSQKPTEEWYAWFEKAEPPPPPRDPNLDSPVGPGGLDLSPDRPDLSFPGSEVSKALTTPAPEEGPSLEPAAPATTPSEKPADTSPEKPAEKPAEAPAEKPAADADVPPEPAEEKPAEPAENPAEEKAAEEKPADSKPAAPAESPAP